MTGEPQTTEEWYASNRRDRIDSLRRETKRLFGKAVLLRGMHDPEAEGVARAMLQRAASAFWNAEDTEFEVNTHGELDGYGRWVRETFGCKLHFEEGTYYQRCPVAIAHLRVGLSVGFTARHRLCSICGEEYADCPHSASELYEVRGGVGPSGYCAVCGGSECSDHSPEQTYLTPPTQIVTEIASLHEVSIVRKPAQPDARLTSIPVSISALHETLGEPFPPGRPISCDRCLNPCEGGIREVLPPGS
jgi:hypothetical protein